MGTIRIFSPTEQSGRFSFVVGQAHPLQFLLCHLPTHRVQEQRHKSHRSRNHVGREDVFEGSLHYRAGQRCIVQQGCGSFPLAPDPDCSDEIKYHKGSFYGPVGQVKAGPWEKLRQKSRRAVLRCPIPFSFRFINCLRTVPSCRYSRTTLLCAAEKRPARSQLHRCIFPKCS